MINIIDFSTIEIDGINAGDLVSAISNYGSRAADILAAVIAYDAQRQGQADDAATQAEVESYNQQITDLESQLAAARQTIEQQRTQLSALVITDWPGLITALRTAGFYQWLADASVANPDLLDEVAALSAAARSGDRAAVIQNFQTIAQNQPPTTAHLQAWQAVLDARGIPKNLIAFIP